MITLHIIAISPDLTSAYIVLAQTRRNIYMENDNWTCINIIKSESAAAYQLNVMKFYITGVKSLSFQDL